MTTTLLLEWPANPASELVHRYLVFESVDGGDLNFKAFTPTNSFSIESPSSHVYTWAVKAESFVGVSGISATCNGPGAPSTPGQPTVTVIQS